jgi:hypothetical protein
MWFCPTLIVVQAGRLLSNFGVEPDLTHLHSKLAEPMGVGLSSELIHIYPVSYANQKLHRETSVAF